jgi:hypothetical protein
LLAGEDHAACAAALNGHHDRDDQNQRGLASTPPPLEHEHVIVERAELAHAATLYRCIARGVPLRECVEVGALVLEALPTKIAHLIEPRE